MDAEPLRLQRFAPALRDTCDEYLLEYRAELREAIDSGASGVEVAKRHAKVLEGLLGALYCAADAAARQGGLVPEGRCALLAIGGLGRRRVGLHSDLDVLFVCDDVSDPYVTAMAHALLYPLWDCGVEIGHAVRGVDETIALAREDVRTATTLLDARRVAGDRAICDELVRGGRARVFEPRLGWFLTALSDDAAARHARTGGSLYLLEPDVKLSRGALRDLDVALWAAGARFCAHTPSDLARLGVIPLSESDRLAVAVEFLWRVRGLLHRRAGRRQDRLTFDDQEEIAEQLGFIDGVTLAVEQFMQAYYRHARVVAQVSERVLMRARPEMRRPPPSLRVGGDGTAYFGEHLTLERTDELDEDPVLALRLYESASARGAPVYPFARDAIARRCATSVFRDALRDHPEANALFRQLLVRSAHWGGRTLNEELHEVGLLLAMVPEFEPLLGRVQHDVYNVYTVDAHSVKALDRFVALRAGERVEHHSLSARLAIEAPRPEPLALAILLHAIGKTHGPRGASRGPDMARPIAERLGLTPVDVEHTVWLIREQHALYRWATQRDVHDGDVLAELARSVGTLDRLRDLYLLTVCVLSTTNPTAMTAWKATVLEDLYLGLSQLLAGSGNSQRVSSLREEVRVGFAGDAGQEMLDEFVAGMPDRYILANPPGDVRRHARIARDARDLGEGAVTVRVAPGRTRSTSELVVVAPDQAGLLADVTVLLAAHRLEIVSAQIYTRTGRDESTAFDVFTVKSSREISRSVVARLEEELAARLRDQLSVAELFARIPKAPAWAPKGPKIPTQVTVDNAASPRFTIVDVSTRDRVGLLHVIAKSLHEQELSIAVSKVNTEGERVSDVFYVTNKDGMKVKDPTTLATIRATLGAELRAFHETQS